MSSSPISESKAAVIKAAPVINPPVVYEKPICTHSSPSAPYIDQCLCEWEMELYKQELLEYEAMNEYYAAEEEKQRKYDEDYISYAEDCIAWLNGEYAPEDD